MLRRETVTLVLSVELRGQLVAVSECRFAMTGCPVGSGFAIANALCLTTDVKPVHPGAFVLPSGPMTRHPLPAHAMLHVKGPVRIIGPIPNGDHDVCCVR